jgi:succinyl-CoA synthetase alpha subunit
MGHAGAFMVPGEPDARTKITELEHAGVVMVNHPAKFGDAMKRVLGGSEGVSTGSGATGSSQRRGMHTMARRLCPLLSPCAINKTQKRNLYLREDLALNLLRARGINASEYSGKGNQGLLAIGVDRSENSPCIIASPAKSPEIFYDLTKRFRFDYRSGIGEPFFQRGRSSPVG